MRSAALRSVVLGAMVFALEGCAAVGLALLSAGVGVGAGAGVEYAMNGTAHRTFTASLEHVHGVTLTALRRMAITVKTDESTEDGRKLVAQAAERTVEIQLERLSPNATRMLVLVKQGLFFRDRSTAGEIIVQTGQSLERGPALSPKRS